VEKRTFLRQRIQARLAQLLLARGDNMPALAILKELQSEVKRLDDKTLLVEVFLMESQVLFFISSLPPHLGVSLLPFFSLRRHRAGSL